MLGLGEGNGYSGGEREGAMRVRLGGRWQRRDGGGSEAGMACEDVDFGWLKLMSWGVSQGHTSRASVSSTQDRNSLQEGG